MTDPSLLRERLEAVRLKLARASEGKYPEPRLIVVTKTHPADELLPLLELGVTDVGENRVQ